MALRHAPRQLRASLTSNVAYAGLEHIPMKSDRIRRVGKGALLRAVPSRGHGAGASAGSFAHPSILFERNAL
jgi:hypothetical protein